MPLCRARLTFLTWRGLGVLPNLARPFFRRDKGQAGRIGSKGGGNDNKSRIERTIETGFPAVGRKIC